MRICSNGRLTFDNHIRSHATTRYLISFSDGAMTFPEEELPAVAEAEHAVSQEAKNAGVWVSGGGLRSQDEASVVATDGTVVDGRSPESTKHLGGFAIVDVPRATTRSGGLPRSPLPAAALRRSASSCPTGTPDRRRRAGGHAGSGCRAGARMALDRTMSTGGR
jgi:hypothetical protein